MQRNTVIDSASLRFRCQLRLAGVLCEVAANSDVVAHGLRRWRVDEGALATPSLSMHIVVADRATAGSRTPHFRGLKHIVVASFGTENVFTFDLLRRSVSAAISAELAADAEFWNRTLLPVAMGVLGPAAGVVPTHSACLAVDGSGLLIAGPSGAGKSTLAVALAQAGFDFLSDDWTYLALNRGQLAAHGMSVPAKLLPDAAGHFDFLRNYAPTLTLNQELAYDLPMQDLGRLVLLTCELRWFFLLKRTPETHCRIAPISAGKARSYIENGVEPLPVELQEVTRTRSYIVRHVSQLSCWELTYGGPPQVAVEGLHEFFSMQREDVLV